MTAGREQDARETLRAEAADALVRLWNVGDSIDVKVAAYEAADAVIAVLLPSPPATTGAGRCNCATFGSAHLCPIHTQADYDAPASPPATDGDTAAGGEW